MSADSYIPLRKEIETWPAESLSIEPLSKIAHPHMCLEIGPGNGDFILDQCENQPNFHFVAIEKKRKRFIKIAKRAERAEIKNLNLICGDARTNLTPLFRQQSFDKIYILFPDPWPKRRYGKHRLLKPYFAKLLKTLLKDDGEIFVATDDADYAQELYESLTLDSLFKAEESQSLFPTYFESLWKQQGKEISYFRFFNPE